MINLRYFCFVVIQLYLKVRALALFYFINLHHYTYITKSYIPDTSGFNKNIRFRCIPKKNTSELHKNRQSRCIHPSKSINLSNPRRHIIPSEANRRANHSSSPGIPLRSFERVMLKYIITSICSRRWRLPRTRRMDESSCMA